MVQNANGNIFRGGPRGACLPALHDRLEYAVHTSYLRRCRLVLVFKFFSNRRNYKRGRHTDVVEATEGLASPESVLDLPVVDTCLN